MIFSFNEKKTINVIVDANFAWLRWGRNRAQSSR